MVSLPSALKRPVKVAQRSAAESQVARTVALKNELSGDPLLTMPEIQAALGGISYRSLHNLLRSGELKPFRIHPKGQRKVRLSELRRFIAEREAQP